MKRVTLRIPEDKLNFFKELFHQLGLEITHETETPEKDKEKVRERIDKSQKNPERLQNWNEVQDHFNLD